MANTNKNPKGGGSAGDALGIITIVGAVIGLAKPAIDIVAEKLKDRAEERKDWVKIPDLCSKSMPMKQDDAIEALEKINLKVKAVAIQVNNADVKYKDCFESQVVYSDHKPQETVPPGALVMLRYVTLETIEESKRLFDEFEKRRIEVSLGKAEKRSEQKEKNKKIVDGVVSTIQQKTISVVTKVKEIKGTNQIRNTSEEDEV